MEKTLTFLLGAPPRFPLVCPDFALRPLGLFLWLIIYMQNLPKFLAQSF